MILGGCWIWHTHFLAWTSDIQDRIDHVLEVSIAAPSQPRLSNPKIYHGYAKKKDDFLRQDRVTDVFYVRDSVQSDKIDPDLKYDIEHKYTWRLKSLINNPLRNFDIVSLVFDYLDQHSWTQVRLVDSIWHKAGNRLPLWRRHCQVKMDAIGFQNGRDVAYLRDLIASRFHFTFTDLGPRPEGCIHAELNETGFKVKVQSYTEDASYRFDYDRSQILAQENLEYQKFTRDHRQDCAKRINPCFLNLDFSNLKPRTHMTQKLQVFQRELSLDNDNIECENFKFLPQMSKHNDQNQVLVQVGYFKNSEQGFYKDLYITRRNCEFADVCEEGTKAQLSTHRLPSLESERSIPIYQPIHYTSFPHRLLSIIRHELSQRLHSVAVMQGWNQLHTILDISRDGMVLVGVGTFQGKQHLWHAIIPRFCHTDK